MLWDKVQAAVAEDHLLAAEAAAQTAARKATLSVETNTPAAVAAAAVARVLHVVEVQTVLTTGVTNTVAEKLRAMMKEAKAVVDAIAVVKIQEAMAAAEAANTQEAVAVAVVIQVRAADAVVRKAAVVVRKGAAAIGVTNMAAAK